MARTRTSRRLIWVKPGRIPLGFAPKVKRTAVESVATRMAFWLHSRPMNSRARRPLLIWIACCAVLLNALAPSASQLFGATGGLADGWLEICSALGPRYVALDSIADDAAGKPAVPAKSTDAARCPFCVPHAGSVALMPVVAVVLVASAVREVAPRLYFVAPRPLFQWAAARSRAPPTCG